jgi:hypothetical protein
MISILCEKVFLKVFHVHLSLHIVVFHKSKPGSFLIIWNKIANLAKGVKDLWTQREKSHG